MASFRVICLAGVASLAAGAVHAADLLPPPPPIEAPFIPQAPSLGGNWYLRGDVGVGISDTHQSASQFDQDYSIPGLDYATHTVDDSSIYDIGVGYRFNDYFRADITGGYRGSSQIKAIETYIGRPVGIDTYTGSVRSITGLINGYVDVGTWYGITPWGGVGIGVANVQIKNITDMGAEQNDGSGAGYGYAIDHSQTNLAFAFMAGLDFAVTQNLTMELGYRYLNEGTAKTGAIQCPESDQCPHEVQHYKIASNDLRLGFRYLLASNPPPPPPQYPLIRKY